MSLHSICWPHHTWGDLIIEILSLNFSTKNPSLTTTTLPPIPRIKEKVLNLPTWLFRIWSLPYLHLHLGASSTFIQVRMNCELSYNPVHFPIWFAYLELTIGYSCAVAPYFYLKCTSYAHPSDVSLSSAFLGKVFLILKTRSDLSVILSFSTLYFIFIEFASLKIFHWLLD